MYEGRALYAYQARLFQRSDGPQSVMPVLAFSAIGRRWWRLHYQLDCERAQSFQTLQRVTREHRPNRAPNILRVQLYSAYQQAFHRSIVPWSDMDQNPNPSYRLYHVTR